MIRIQNNIADPNNKLDVKVVNELIAGGNAPIFGSFTGTITVPARAAKSFTPIYLVCTPDGLDVAVGTSTPPAGFPSRLIGLWGTIIGGTELQRAVQIDKMVQFRGDFDFWGVDLYDFSSNGDISDFSSGNNWRQREGAFPGMAPANGFTAALIFRLEAKRKASAGAGIAQVNLASIQPGGSMEFRAQAKGYCRADQKEAYADGVILPVGADTKFWAYANTESQGHVMGSGFILAI